MRHSSSILEKLAKGFLSATFLFSPGCDSNSEPTPTPRPPEADAVRVEEVSNGVAYWIEGDPNTSSQQEVNELENELRELGEERIEYIIDFALHSHPVALAAVQIINKIPSVGENFNPVMAYYLKTEHSEWTQNLTVTEDEEIVIALAYQPGEAMINPEHRGLEAVVSKGPVGQEIVSFTLLRSNEYPRDSPNFIVSDPKSVWKITSMDNSQIIPYVDRVYSIGTSPIGEDNATLVVKYNQPTPTPDPTPRPSPTPDPGTRPFSNIPAGWYESYDFSLTLAIDDYLPELFSDTEYYRVGFNDIGERLHCPPKQEECNVVDIGYVYYRGKERRQITEIAQGIDPLGRETVTYDYVISGPGFYDRDGSGSEEFTYLGSGELKLEGSNTLYYQGHTTVQIVEGIAVRQD